MIKYRQNINEFQYVLSFDLAKRVSGYTLWDFKNDEVLDAGIIDTHLAPQDFIWGYFYDKIIEIINECINKIGQNKRALLFLTKEKLPNQNGPHSTIETLQGLAQAHAIFDLAVNHSGVEVYDYEGVHSVSVKAYFKTLILNTDKPQKEDIGVSIKARFDKFDFDNFPLDVTDSLAVAMTLIEKKYKADIGEEKRRLKKELKAAKSAIKQSRIKEQIVFLDTLVAN